MQVFPTEQIEAHAVCLIQLEGDERYNDREMIQACLDYCGGKYAGSATLTPIADRMYKVSVKTGYHPQDDIFAEMVKEYGRA